jgi:hypothetical protein
MAQHFSVHSIHKSNFRARMDSKVDESEWEIKTNTSQWRLITIASFLTI